MKQFLLEESVLKTQEVNDDAHKSQEIPETQHISKTSAQWYTSFTNGWEKEILQESQDAQRETSSVSYQLSYNAF